MANQKTGKVQPKEQVQEQIQEQVQEQVQEQEQPKGKETTFKEDFETFSEAYQALYTSVVKMQRKARAEHVPSVGRIIQLEKALARNARNLKITLPSKFDIKW